MAKRDQANIIREQMQANQRIIRASASASAASQARPWAVGRTTLGERIKQFAFKDVTRTKSSPRPPKSK